MDKEIRPQITYEENNTSQVFWVLFTDTAIMDLCLNLSLLQFDLIESILFINGKSGKSLRIKKAKRKDIKLKNKRGQVSARDEEFVVTISEREIEYWLSFFLLYYRDGTSVADHIDFDVWYDDKKLGPMQFQLALQIKLQPPLKPQLIDKS